MSRFCVVEGTKITLNDKETIPIERIKVGQEILSFDLNTLQKSQKYDILVKMKTNDFDVIYVLQKHRIQDNKMKPKNSKSL